MDANPLPCLKEPRWEGRTHAVCRPMWAGETSPLMPWLAFGFDHPDSFEFIDTDRLPQLNVTTPALEARALASLGRRPAKWEPVDADIPNGPRLRMLVCSEDFFAAERILDGPFMQEAERLLSGRGALVGVPRRGVLLATAIGQDQAQVSAFGTMVAGQFSGGESAPISPLLFVVRDGAIVGLLDAVAHAFARKAAAATTSDAAAAPATPHVQPRAAAAPPANPPFYWWTSLPSLIRLGIGLLIGLIILNRFLTDFAISLLP